MSKELNKALELLREIRPSIPKDVLELWCADRDDFLASQQGKQCSTTQLVGDLLAVIHRDGGHYQDEHGIAKALIDAKEVVNQDRIDLSEWQHAAETAHAGAKKLADYAVQLESKAASKHPEQAEGATPVEAVIALMSAERIDPEQESVEQAGGDERAAFESRAEDAGSDISRDDFGNYVNVYVQTEWEGWQARAALAQPSGEVVVTKNESGAIVSVTRQDKEGRLLSVIAESQPSPAQAEKAEAERPEVVAWRYGFSGGIVSDKACLDEWKSGGEYQSLMTVAQHERIVGELRAVIAQLRQHKNDYMDSGQETYRALQNEIREREAEIDRLDGLVSGRTAERDAALAEVNRLRESKGDPSGSFDRCMRMMYERDENAKRLDAALARVAELDKQCRDDVARALGLRPSQERGFAWSYLLASIKSCVKASEDAAQAQHSVPEGYALIPTRETEAMHDAVMALLYKGVARTDTQKLLDAYIAAAPGNEGL
ncbi:hypothetical protein [Pseudomonas aeruginosa]|uniref:hypothetical protein n=1 Tax=Pseudomonas aeruginosa TaxID=287 RepID=UPI003CEB2152